MNSLQSYGQGEPVYDDKAYTFAKFYHSGQLKMYTISTLVSQAVLGAGLNII
jgi:hypothetical protein